MKKIFKLLLLIFVAVIVIISCKKPAVTPLPTITSISPTSGLAGVSVTITGANFDASASNNTVKFNGTTATITSASTTSLVVTAPAAGSTGIVTVTTTAGIANGPTFTYLMPPTVTAISPTSGIANTVVTISGTNFKTTTTNNVVKFNGVSATVQTATSNSLTVLAPASTTGVVSITTSDGTANGPTFTYIPAPTIISINPTSGQAGSAVTITGTNFDATAANDVVKFNGVSATITSATTTQLVVTVPATGATGNVTVTTVGGTSNGIVFTYITGPTVYISGVKISTGTGYWSNTTFINMVDCNQTNAITGSGTDIYIAGTAVNNTPTIWKNGTSINLSVQTGYTTSIFVTGTDVYAAGVITNLPTAPYMSLKYWKNGTANTLTISTPSTVNSIYVSGTDVYAAGLTTLSANPFYQKATYWKNGTPIDLTTGFTSNASATAVLVVGSDVYVAGVEEEKSGNIIIDRAPRLWKNGVSVPLTIPANSLNTVSSVLVVGSDVYVGGQCNGAGTVWKNGTIINPSVYAVAEQVTNMFLYNGTDLYITGSSSVSGNNCYWKNGSFVEMDPGTASGAVYDANNVSGIYVR